MSSPSQYIADRFPWLTRARAVAGSFGIALLVVFIWPHARLVTDLVIVTAIHVPRQVASAMLIGVDLGPNLSVTGSLATILWLSALRRENQQVSAWSFLKLGALVMPPALLLAIAGLLVTGSIR